MPEYGVPRIVLQGPVQDIVAGIWSSLLRVGDIGPEDDFFELGGHSLLVTRMASRLSAAFGVEVPVGLVFETPTVAGVAAVVESLCRGDTAPMLPPVEVADRTAPLPLSFAQQRIWFLDQLTPGNSFYNVPAPYRIRGALEVSALERALTGLVARHEVLRTVIGTAADGSPVQVVTAPAPVRLPIAEVPGASSAERAARLLDLVSAEATALFDLRTGPVLRATLLRLDPADHVLLVVLHHAFTDGWSMGVLNRDLSALYAAEVAGQQPDLPALAVQYADYACWQHEWFATGVLDTQLAYWRRRLAGSPPATELPTDRPRPGVATYDADSLGFHIPGPVVAKLRDLATSERATLYMALLAAFKAILVRYTGQTDVVIGAPVANRRRPEFEDLIGFFVNTVVLRTDCSGDPSFRELLRRVRETTVGAYAHQDFPFERLVSELGDANRDLGRNPLTQIMFQLLNVPFSLPVLGAAEVAPLPDITTPTRFDIEMHLAETPGGVAGVVSYDRALYDRTTIEGLARNYVGLLSRLVEAA